MLRFILLSILFLLVFYIIKGLLKGLKSQKVLKTGSKHDGKTPVTDILVQDPVCGVYCAKRDALSLNWQGKTYYFCSDKCKNKFREQKKKS